MDYLDQYLERDCFFTIGPDVRINPAVQQVVTKAPLDRLLVETDGLAAIEWALGRKALSEDWPALLLDGVDYVAEIKAVSRDRVLKEMHLSSKIG